MLVVDVVEFVSVVEVVLVVLFVEFVAVEDVVLVVGNLSVEFERVVDVVRVEPLVSVLDVVTSVVPLLDVVAMVDPSVDVVEPDDSVVPVPPLVDVLLLPGAGVSSSLLHWIITTLNTMANAIKSLLALVFMIVCIYAYHRSQYRAAIINTFIYLPIFFTSSLSLVRSRRKGVIDTRPFSIAQRSVPSSAGSSGNTVDQKIFLP